jgi:GNAT superfamily N-acetyltransferase
MQGTTGVMIHTAAPVEAGVIGTLIDACMVELYQRRWNSTPGVLAADLDVGRLCVAIATRGEPIGLIAWAPAYDIHHCVRGGEIAELYVAPAHRGRGVAPQLIAHACRAIGDGGGVFVRGTAVASAVPLYARIAWGWDCREMILGGRAFRAMAALAGASPRAIVRGLPDPSWNHE